MRRFIHLCVLIVLPIVSLSAASDTLYRLPIGDPARKDREVPIALDVLVDAANGQRLTPDELAAALRPTRLLLLGESHTSTEFHRVQLQVLRALHRTGRRVLVGLEMYPYTEQGWLDRWNAGTLTEEAFVTGSRWYEHWGYHWNYYRDIFLFAREAGIPLHAVNAPREVISAVRKKGFKDLTPEEAAHIPTDIDVDSADHLAFFKASLTEGDSPHPGMSEEALEGMLAAQATWDATMGWNAAKALDRADDRAAIMVVLVGSGHVAYGVGIERQARRWVDGRMTSLIPVPIEDDRKPVTHARASYANFVYGVAGERHSAYPSIGISSVPAQGGRRVIDVQKKSPAGEAALLVGDLLTSIDGHPVASRELFNRVMAGKLWGDVVRLGFRRGDEAMAMEVGLRRIDD